MRNCFLKLKLSNNVREKKTSLVSRCLPHFYLDILDKHFLNQHKISPLSQQPPKTSTHPVKWVNPVWKHIFRYANSGPFLKRWWPHRLQVQCQHKPRRGLVCSSSWYQLLFWCTASVNLKEAYLSRSCLFFPNNQLCLLF